MTRTFRICLTAALLALGAAPAAKAQDQFPLRDGDTWVMAGDSITAQRLHTNYFEAYCYTRFPEWTIHFRNSGVSGDRIPNVLARFAWDVAAWNPTVVSVELGMNDESAGVNSAPGYIKGMEMLTERITGIHARPVFLTASPANDGSTTGKMEGHINVTLDRYAAALVEFAAGQKAPCADQFHALLDLWGKNKAGQELQAEADAVRKMAARPGAPRADLLNAWLEDWKKSALAAEADGSVNLLGDRIHTGPPGQLTMCAALLRGLGAPEMVSQATLDAQGKVVEAVRCKIDDLKAENGGLSFTRTDQCLPMPIPDDARPALVIMPQIADLSRWMLTVKGLGLGEYDLSIDGTPVARLSAEALAKGFNMGTLEKGPVAEQGRRVLALITTKENVAGDFRAKSKAVATAPADQAKAALDPLAQRVLECDAKIRAAAQPVAHHFVVAPAK